MIRNFIRQLLGTEAGAAASRDADPDDLFGMSTAYITMDAELGYPPSGEAALCFGDVDSRDFRETLEEVADILEVGQDETDTTAEIRTDDHGYRWVVLSDGDTEDLLTSIHFAADTFVERGHGSRLLAALFAFERPDGGYAYWIYSFRRGSYYPFAPEGTGDRDDATELKLQGHLDGELDVESAREYWYPLWPDRPGVHPWT